MSGKKTAGPEVRVAIVGVGNCASSLVQGVQYYQDADENATVPGLMHVRLGPYHVRDVKFVAAFDVDAKKVGFDLSEATQASENNTIKIADVPPTNVTVQVYRALLENMAGFYGSQMTAMENATRNAGDMINRLSIQYNRQRQAAITTELVEIISGAEAL